MRERVSPGMREFLACFAHDIESLGHVSLSLAVLGEPKLNYLLKHFPALTAGPVPGILKLLDYFAVDFAIELFPIASGTRCGHAIINNTHVRRLR